MTCCAPGLGNNALTGGAPSRDELKIAARSLGDGDFQVSLALPGVHCAACIGAVEGALRKLPGLIDARVNLTTRRVNVRWRGEEPPPISETLINIGYAPHLFDISQDGQDKTLTELLRAVAISGFAAGNVMLLSVAVWSGADGSTRDLFHWLSALIAIPALFYAGRIFYRSAWSALRHGRMNMDVPIAVGVTMAYAMSIYEVMMHAEHAYFDASVTLLFFLLIGRTLDHMMRDRARSAVIGLGRMQPSGALVSLPDGSREFRPVAEINPGDQLLVAAGERIAVDCIVRNGASDIDASLASGESAPVSAQPGVELRAGVLNLTGPITVEALRPADSSFLAEMTRLMEAAESGKAKYRRIAERVSTYYAPVVHLTALITFFVWIWFSGDWRLSMQISIAVLIITCPCALGLAVPIVQVVAARRLFDAGIMMKDGAALERLREIDVAAFDKTGTLTLGDPRLINFAEIDPKDLAVARALAAHSRHPISKALMKSSGSFEAAVTDVCEIPGSGVEGMVNGQLWRLGRASWAAGDGAKTSGTVLACDGKLAASFEFDDMLRPGAAATIKSLKDDGVAVEMLSGDIEARCADVAKRLGIEHYRSGLLPQDKLSRMQELAAEGKKALLVGDGLNDAPALGAAHVSMAPGSAADIGRNAADFVFLNPGLDAVTLAADVAGRADRLIKQNIGIAIVYNMIAIPIALFGYVTPLIAAIAMSGSSIIVISNAMRLNAKGRAIAPNAAQRELSRQPELKGRHPWQA